MVKKSEAILQDSIIDLAKTLGYLVCHFRPALTANGWRTAIQGDKGFPDIVLAHQERRRVLFIECKSASGKTTPEQDAWLGALAAADEEVYEVRPDSFDEIQEILMMGHKPGLIERRQYDCAVVFER